MLITDNIKVSVIMPVYNVSLFLEEAVNSVQNQTLKDIEIILVNDGSTDGSDTICKLFSKQDDRIKYINQSNLGVSTARNNGLKIAVGEYIFFMDSDDTIDVNFLQTSYNIAKQTSSDLVVIGDYYCKRMPNAPALPAWALLIKNKYLVQHSDIRFPKGIQPCEDGLFSHQLLALTSNISLNPHGAYHYRKHDNQNHLKINDHCEKTLLQIPLWFEILNDFYSRHNLFESHAQHLAFFVEHEPFEFRYLSMPFNHEQKSQLHNLIKNFMNRNVLPFLKSKKQLSSLFLKFIETPNHTKFEKLRAMESMKKRVKILLTKFIPITSYRRLLRDKIRQS